ncbi:MAG: universal stress protein, partial [Gemmatimonadales bacterium]
MYQSILIGVDFSDTSVETVRWTVSRFPEADITLFHAIERLGVPGYLTLELGPKLGMVQERGLDAR